MLIRDLKNKDIPKAMELKILCWPEELAGKAGNTLQLNEQIEFWTEWYNAAIENNDIRIFIGAFENDNMLGVAAGSFIESKDSPQEGIELNGLWVFPEHRGRGISLRMLLYIINIFIPFGVNRMEVYNPHHAPSNLFYKKFGGKVIRQEYQEDGQLLVDIFEFDLYDFRNRLEKTLLHYT